MADGLGRPASRRTIFQAWTTWPARKEPLPSPSRTQHSSAAFAGVDVRAVLRQCPLGPVVISNQHLTGARRRNRTANLLLTGQALYLLSYTGKNGTPSTSLAGAAERFSRGAGHSAGNARKHPRAEREWSRTANPRLTGALLSRLSYGGVVACPSCLVEPAGLEPAYHLLAGQVLYLLSYGPSQAAWITARELLSGFRETRRDCTPPYPWAAPKDGVRENTSKIRIEFLSGLGGRIRTCDTPVPGRELWPS